MDGYSRSYTLGCEEHFLCPVRRRRDRGRVLTTDGGDEEKRCGDNVVV